MPDVNSKCAGCFTLRCSTLVATFVAFTAVTSAPAQGTIRFETRVPGVVDAPVYLWTGELADDDFVALLYVGSDAVGSAGYVRVMRPWASPGSDVYVRMRAWAPVSRRNRHHTRVSQTSSAFNSEVVVTHRVTWWDCKASRLRPFPNLPLLGCVFLVWRFARQPV